MEVIGGYEIPDSWTAKGMNWNTPDPTNADYVMAIRQALLERCAVLHKGADSRIYRISPWKTVSRDVMKGIVWTVSDIAKSFVNINWEEFEEDYSDFPKMWTYGDIIQERGCRLYEFAKYGSLVENGGEWLKQIKNAIDKLTVIRAGRVHGRHYSRSGSRHDPPFDESIGDAMKMAFDTMTDGKLDAKFPTSIYAWSGNTHWKCPDPDYEGSRPEDNVDGYCGYAKSVSYKFAKIRSWLAEREFDFLGYALIDECTGPVSYSQELATSVFDAGSCDWKKGLNKEKEHIDDPNEVDYEFGFLDNIPQNEVVPTSDFDENGSATHRRSAKRGYEGKCWFFMDYGCTNGFNFRSERE